MSENKESGVYVGWDIGGTKCAAVVGVENGGQVSILSRQAFATPASQSEAVERLCALSQSMAEGRSVRGVGISVGGPMDAKSGMLCDPPNLPGWHGLSLTDAARQALHAPAVLENDANACALAEWRWGAGQGSRSLVFLTFGTGLGAGIVLDGNVLAGAHGNAGEVGHWRLSEFGPVGYGKSGSFEGFCSGGGLKQLGESIGLAHVQRGEMPRYWGGEISARTLADAARKGDAAAQEVFSLCAAQLGRGLALLCDVLDPDCIVIGSVYARCEDLLCEGMRKTLDAEALSPCRVVPAALGERIGDCAALALAFRAEVEG